MLAGTGSSSSAIETIFEEARIDPPPSPAAETIAALLYRHAETARQRSAAIQARLEAEEAAEAAVRAESRALEAEVSQYRGWISEELEGGAAYRLSKNLHDERDRCVALEEQVRGLKLHLAEMATELRALVQHAEQEPAEVVQQRATRLRPLPPKGAYPRYTACRPGPAPRSPLRPSRRAAASSSPSRPYSVRGSGRRTREQRKNDGNKSVDFEQNLASSSSDLLTRTT